MIKSGKYRPNVDGQSANSVPKKKSSSNGSSSVLTGAAEQNSSHEEEDEGNDSYLHPLLRGGTTNESQQANKKSAEPVRTPSVPMNIHNTAYGQLIKKYEHLRQREKVATEEKLSPRAEEMKNEESSYVPIRIATDTLHCSSLDLDPNHLRRRTSFPHHRMSNRSSINSLNMSRAMVQPSKNRSERRTIFGSDFSSEITSITTTIN